MNAATVERTQDETSTVVMENAPCPLGCPPADDPVLSGRDRLHGLPGEFTVVKCRRCGLMRTNPRPTQVTMGYYYPDDYAPHQTFDVGTDTGRARSAVERLARRLIRFNTQCLPPLPPGRMLEVGCGSGSFLHKMAAAGWQVEGMEFSPRAAQAAAALGYRIHIGALETAPEPAAGYDVIAGWMVLEHLHRPVDALLRLGRWIKPGGWLAISVPNAAALEFRVFKDCWYALQLPTHLFHYTPRTLERVLHHGGWRLEKVFHQRILSNLFFSLGYRLGDKRPDSRLARIMAAAPEAGVGFNVAMYPLAWPLSLFGQTGRMTAWARKL